MRRLARCQARDMALNAGQLRLGVNCLPFGVPILTHVDAASDGVSVNGSFEGPGNRVSWNLHVAMKLDLIGVNHALEFRIVDLTVLHTAEFVAALLDRELLLPRATRVLNRDGPSSLDRSGSGGWNNRIFIVARFGQALVDSIPYDSILTGIHHVRHDGDGTRHFIGPLSSATIDNDAGRTGIEAGDEFCTSDLQHVGIPVNTQTRSLVGEVLGFEILETDRRQRLQPGLDVLEPGAPLTLLCGMVAFVPLLNRGEETHSLLLAALESPTITMVRCSLIIGCLAQIFLTDQHSGRLWSTQTFAARVTDKSCSCGDVDVWDDRLFRGSIDEDGNAFLLRDGADTRDAQRALFCSRAGEDIDHGGAVRDLGPQVLR